MDNGSFRFVRSDLLNVPRMTFRGIMNWRTMSRRLIIRITTDPTFGAHHQLPAYVNCLRRSTRIVQNAQRFIANLRRRVRAPIVRAIANLRVLGYASRARVLKRPQPRPDDDLAFDLNNLPDPGFRPSKRPRL